MPASATGVAALQQRLSVIAADQLLVVHGTIARGAPVKRTVPEQLKNYVGFNDVDIFTPFTMYVSESVCGAESEGEVQGWFYGGNTAEMRSLYAPLPRDGREYLAILTGIEEEWFLVGGGADLLSKTPGGFASSLTKSDVSIDEAKGACP
jgi:hypothetical protein